MIASACAQPSRASALSCSRSSKSHVKPSPTASQSTPSWRPDLLLADLPVAALDELHDGDLPAPGDAREHHAERGRALALAVAGVDDHERRCPSQPVAVGDPRSAAARRARVRRSSRPGSVRIGHPAGRAVGSRPLEDPAKSGENPALTRNGEAARPRCGRVRSPGPSAMTRPSRQGRFAGQPVRSRLVLPIWRNPMRTPLIAAVLAGDHPDRSRAATVTTPAATMRRRPMRDRRDGTATPAATRAAAADRRHRAGTDRCRRRPRPATRPADTAADGECRRRS